jgi:hypothetical protein
MTMSTCESMRPWPVFQHDAIKVSTHAMSDHVHCIWRACMAWHARDERVRTPDRQIHSERFHRERVLRASSSSELHIGECAGGTGRRRRCMWTLGGRRQGARCDTWYGRLGAPALPMPSCIDTRRLRAAPREERIAAGRLPWQSATAAGALERARAGSGCCRRSCSSAARCAAGGRCASRPRARPDCAARR